MAIAVIAQRNVSGSTQRQRCRPGRHAKHRARCHGEDFTPVCAAPSRGNHTKRRQAIDDEQDGRYQLRTYDCAAKRNEDQRRAESGEAACQSRNQGYGDER
jgi:hypothetical protein